MSKSPKEIGPCYHFRVHGRSVVATQWPRIGLWRQEAEEWVEVVPALALNRSGPRAGMPADNSWRDSRSVEHDRAQSVREFSKWLADVPIEILREARRYGLQGYRLLRFFSVGGDLAVALSTAGNEALCIALAHAESFMEPAVPLSPQSAAELMSLSLHQIVGQLGFPAKDESVSILAHTKAIGIKPSPKPFIQQLRRAMNDPEIYLILQGAPCVDEKSLATLLATVGFLALSED